MLLLPHVINVPIWMGCVATLYEDGELYSCKCIQPRHICMHTQSLFFLLAVRVCLERRQVRLMVAAACHWHALQARTLITVLTGGTPGAMHDYHSGRELQSRAAKVFAAGARRCRFRITAIRRRRQVMVTIRDHSADQSDL